MDTSGARLFELQTDHLARELLRALRDAPSGARAQVTPDVAAEALLEALVTLAEDADMAPFAHVVERAKELWLNRCPPGSILA